MEITTVKISYSRFFDYKAALELLAKESHPLSWTATRCLIYSQSIVKLYGETLKGLVDVYGLKDDKGKLVLIDSSKLPLFNNIKLKDEKGYQVYEDLNKEEIDVKIYKPTLETVIEYLKTNPPSINYLNLDGILFDCEKIQL